MSKAHKSIVSFNKNDLCASSFVNRTGMECMLCLVLRKIMIESTK